MNDLEQESLLEQIKTTRGEIPTSAVKRLNQDGTTMLEFTPCTPSREQPEKRSTNGKTRGTAFADLAFINANTLIHAAKRIGPLFGLNLIEDVRDWQDAANVAFSAAQIQEVANGNKPSSILNADARGTIVAKTTVTERVAGKQFAIYAVSIPLFSSEHGAYRTLLPSMPWHQRFAGDGVDYALATIDEENGISHLTITLLSFPKEISSADLSFILQTFCGLNQQQGEAVARKERNEPNRLSRPDALLPKEASIGNDDVGKLRRLVQTLASIHLENVHLDVFRSNTDDDFLLFDSRLSYFWYAFAKNLGDVKIGYCERCGNPFSLAGHRGIGRRYCSQECKTQAKNQRTKDTRDTVRRLYFEGNDLKQIAEICYESLSYNLREKRIRSDLSTWVELKHRARSPITEDQELKQRIVADRIFERRFVNL